MSNQSKRRPVVLSIGIRVWNEEDSIRAPLESLFRQSIFERLCIRHEQCEIVVVAHACTDQTAAVVRSVFAKQQREHTWTDGFVARVIDIPEPGAPGAWNRFVHEFSAVEARFICSMHPHVVFPHRETLYNLMAVLERRPHVAGATGRACPDVIFRKRKTLRERICLATAAIAGGEDDPFDGQLYCLRAGGARSLFVPRDLGPAGDEFIRQMVCTDYLTRDPAPGRFVTAPGAAHIVEAPASPRDVMEQRKRQMMGQAAVHVITEHLKSLGWEDRINLADTLRRLETRDPDWLKRLVAAHLKRRPFCWQLFPGVLSLPLKRLRQRRGLRKITQLPAALAGITVALNASARAHRTLRVALTDFRPGGNGPAAVGAPQVRAK